MRRFPGWAWAVLIVGLLALATTLFSIYSGAAATGTESLSGERITSSSFGIVIICAAVLYFARAQFRK